MPRIVHAASSLALLMLAACYPAPPAAAPVAPAAAVQGDPALTRCLGLVPGERPACYEAALLSRLETEGVAAAMAALERLGEVDPEVKRDGHVFAHAIGLAAYESPASVGATFALCTPSYQSGCYHGVVQSYFADQAEGGAGATPEAVNALCRDYRGDGSDRWLLFQCAHGMGHGLTAITAHHLPKALAGCDLLEEAWEREACYGGAFMESIVQATAPHHSIGRPEAAGAAGGGHEHHGEHDMSAAEEVAPYRALDPADPLYPCSALETRYLYSCYQMQTSAVLFLNGGDFQATAAVCGTAPAEYRRVCFQSLGRDVSAYTVQDHGRAIELCGGVGEEYRPFCHVGYVKNLVDLTADADDGFAYCRLLPASPSKESCYTAVGEQVWVLGTTTQRREELCRPAESPYLSACRRGAGLSEGES